MKLVKHLKMAAYATLTLGTFSGIAHAETRVDDEVIYGDDNRKEVFDPTANPRMVELSRSTAALMKKESLQSDERDASMLKLPTRTFAETYNACPTEPYRDQPNSATCSGFLVGDDVLVTAGHCVDSQSACEGTAFVFGFGYDVEGKDLSRIKAQDVYYCKELVAQEATRQTDFAIVQLDRKVQGRAPLKYRKEGIVEQGTPVTVIGNPIGLPTKIADGAIVRDNSPAGYFAANLDSYGGNSGSAVFNSNTGEVEGILVRGESDFETGDNDCRLSKRCTNDSCRGEEVTRATVFAVHVPNTSVPPRPTVSHSYETANVQHIPDNSEAGVVQEVLATDTGTLAGVGVHVKITHPYVGDLTLTLVHPDGTEVTLRKQAGGGADTIDEIYGVGGYTIPGLNQLKGKPAAGTWKLKVQDTSTDDEGTLDAVKLTTVLYAD